MLTVFIGVWAGWFPAHDASIVGHIECGPVVAAHHAGDAVLIWDQDGIIHRLDLEGKEVAKWGGRGQGPGEFEPFFVSLMMENDQLTAVDRSGMAYHRFDRGVLLASKKSPAPRVLYSSGVEIGLKRLTPRNAYAKTAVQMFNGEGALIDQVILFDDSRRAAAFMCGVNVLGDQVLIGTTTGLEPMVDVVILDLKERLFLRRAPIRMMDPRTQEATEPARREALKNPDQTITMVQGWTGAPELNGWVMTESGVSGSYRVIQVIRSNGEDEVTKVYYPKGATNWTWFQHLKGNRWVVHDGSELLVVDLS